jgi:exopolyphosphatase
VLDYGGLKTSDLITLDDLRSTHSSSPSFRPEDTSWILVDHNALQGQLGQVYARQVVGVIDHHDDEHKVPENMGCEPRIVEKAGSCTSLVTNYVRDSWDKIIHSNAENEENSLWNAEVAQMALCSILTDTANLTDSSKVTSHDEKAVQYLEAKIRGNVGFAKNYKRESLYEEVSKAKQDIGHLMINDILRKDYKEWEDGGKRLGISSVVKPLRFLIFKTTRPEQPSSGTRCEWAFANAMDSVCEQRQLDVYAIMTAFVDRQGEFQRELLVRCTKESSVAVAESFAKGAREELGLTTENTTPVPPGKSKWQKVWRQTQVQHSRKRVAPLLRDAMSAK